MKTTLEFQKMKQNKERISMITAYDAPSAKLAETAGIDVILVGDSVGMVVLGYDSTIPVTMDDMIHHAKAVGRGAKDTFILVDMPFLTYHGSISETFHHAKRLMQVGGAHAVKLEGSDEVFETTKKLVAAGVPVVSHLGLTPQSVGVIGGYRVQGKSEEDAKKLLEESKNAEEAGACMLVLECVPETLAKEITESLSIPVIGIGAGKFTDGQVLVFHDVIGYTQGYVPKFVKKYANVSDVIRESIRSFQEDVKKGDFPEEKHSFQTAINNTTQKLYGGK
ncbi:3-methyl-2-oxobutanoate hydroxymethyltransferase [Evansella sp. AB-rgal1]|uniref:3-methyl-2-oxobutanoate hydroxymethyltransferase n=1 Tax=Evansella sp. AB-rgal1 TaxID=3242696 RepID=UPI00359D5DC1